VFAVKVADEKFIFDAGDISMKTSAGKAPFELAFETFEPFRG